MPYIRGAQPAAVQPHAALGDQLCDRAYIISVDSSSKTVLLSHKENKNLIRTKTLIQMRNFTFKTLI